MNTPRALNCVEGGFAANRHRQTRLEQLADAATVQTADDYSQMVNLYGNRQSLVVTTPPNSNVLYAAPADIPCLSASLSPGTHWLACYVSADQGTACPLPEGLNFDPATPQVTVNGNPFTLV